MPKSSAIKRDHEYRGSTIKAVNAISCLKPLPNDSGRDEIER